MAVDAGIVVDMNAKPTQTVFAEALRLNRQARADLASELTASIDGRENERVANA